MKLAYRRDKLTECGRWRSRAVILFHAFPRICPGRLYRVWTFLRSFWLSDYQHHSGGPEPRRSSPFRLLFAENPQDLPALVAVLAACWAVGCCPFCFPMSGMRWPRTSWQERASIPIFCRRSKWLFDPVSQRQPLLHLGNWASKSKFYIFWPVTADVAVEASAMGARRNLVARGNFVRAECRVSETRPVAKSFLYNPAMRMWELLGERHSRGSTVQYGEAKSRAVREALGQRGWRSLWRAFG